MNFSMKLITPPEIEPVSLTEVKKHAHIDHSVQDTILETWITSGRELAEGFQRRAYIGQVWEIAFDGFPEMPIRLPRPPLISVMSIKCYDIANVETILYEKADNPVTTTEEAGSDYTGNSDFIIDASSIPGRIDLAYGKTWPSIITRSINALVIRYAAGYGLDAEDVPANVKDAIMIYCTARNENRAGEADFLKCFHDILRPDRLEI